MFMRLIRPVVKLFCSMISVCVLAMALPGTIQAIQLDSQEYKLLLKADNFADKEQGYRAYWEKVRQTAGESGIGVVENANPFAEDAKQVMYLDTKNMELTKQNYILRLRTKYVDGQPAADSELTLKYRVPELQGITELSVQTARGYKSVSKLQEDCVGYYRGQAGVNGGEFGLSRALKKIPRSLRTTLGDYAVFFPTLNELGIAATEPVSIINNLMVREVKVSPGELDFGDGLKGEVTISLWYDENSSKLIAAEFSYEVDLINASGKSLEKCRDFFNQLQNNTQSTLYPGQTKVQFVYDYK
ncbi:hypothetical protein SRRS_14280 [Sporomusa rhizae]|uniref:hypothetical protein n=1 Tax=Sporomusa rhizae TaxID=357999 RepID=UPI003529E5C2